MELSAHLEQYGLRRGSSTPNRTHPMRPRSASSPGHLMYSSSPAQLGKRRLRREEPFEEPRTPPRSPAAATQRPCPGATDDDPMRCFHDGSYLAPLVPMVLAKDAEIRRQAICALANLTDEQARPSPSPSSSPSPSLSPSPSPSASPDRRAAPRGGRLPQGRARALAAARPAAVHGAAVPDGATARGGAGPLQPPALAHDPLLPARGAPG